MNEKIKLIDGTEKEVTIKPISYRMRNEIMSKCATTKYGGNGQDANIDLFMLQTLALERIVKGIDLNNIDPAEGDRVFQKYCASAFGMGNDSKNSETTSETQ